MGSVRPLEPERYFERYYMTKYRRRVYVALEDLDFTFDEADLPMIIHMWEEGLSIWDIARAFDRDPDEITVLIMDLVRKDRIKPRPRGAYGRRREG